MLLNCINRFLIIIQKYFLILNFKKFKLNTYWT